MFSADFTFNATLRQTLEDVDLSTPRDNVSYEDSVSFDEGESSGAGEFFDHITGTLATTWTMPLLGTGIGEKDGLGRVIEYDSIRAIFIKNKGSDLLRLTLSYDDDSTSSLSFDSSDEVEVIDIPPYSTFIRWSEADGWQANRMVLENVTQDYAVTPTVDLFYIGVKNG